MKTKYAFLAGLLVVSASIGIPHAFAQNVGIGIPIPQEKLDVAGSLRVDGRVSMIPQVVAAADAITADATRSTIIVQTTSGVQTNAITLTGTPAPGQVLYITNLDDDAATFGSTTIPASETRGFLYRAMPSAGWTLLAASGTDNLGDHTATAPLNMGANPIQDASAISVGTPVQDGQLNVASISPDVVQPDFIMLVNLQNTLGQSFTAGTTGPLSQIDLLCISSVSGPSIYLEVYAGQVNTFTTPLGTSNTVPLSTSNSWKAFNFSPGVMLTAGQQYTIRIRQASGLPNQVAIPYSNSNPYPNGRQLVGGTFQVSNDLAFKTYVSASYLLAKDRTVSIAGNLEIGADGIVSIAGNLGIGADGANAANPIEVGSGAGVMLEQTAYGTANLSTDGQSFISPRTTLLTDIEVFTSTAPGQSTNITMQLYAGETTSTASPLGTSNAQTLTGSGFIGSNGWTKFTFATPISITYGQTYTFRLTRNTTSTICLSSSANPYAGGQLCTPGGFSSGEDMAFRLYGSVPLFWVAADGTVNAPNLDALSAIHENNGNIGLGITNPFYILDVTDSRATDFIANFQNNGNNGKGINITINDPTNNIMNGGFKDEDGPDDTWYDTDGGYEPKIIFTGYNIFTSAPEYATNPAYAASLLDGTSQTNIEALILSAENASTFMFKDNEPDVNASRYYYGVDADNEFIRFTGADDATAVVAGSIQGFSYRDYTEAYSLDACAAFATLSSFATLDPLGLLISAVAATCEADAEVQFGVTYASGGGDYAEYLERENHLDVMTRGEIVGVRSGKISRNLDGAEKLMVISSRPIVLGNMPQEGREAFYEKVAFLGQAEIRIRGAVQAGDYILPSGKNDGYGVPVSPANMQPADYARVVGRAWESNVLGGPKFINCIVGLHNNEWANVLQGLQQQVNDLKQANTDLKQAAQTLQQQQDDFRAEMRAEMQSLRKEIQQTTSYSAE